MTVFDLMAETLFGDPNLALDAEYRAGGDPLSDPVVVKVIRTNPDRTSTFGEGKFRQSTCILEVQTIDAPALAKGDTFTIGSVLYTLREDPERDNDRRIWKAGSRES